MERCANTEALNRYEREQDEAEHLAEMNIDDFRCNMEDAIIHLISEFNKHSKSNNINRTELRAILLEDLGEQL